MLLSGFIALFLILGFFAWAFLPSFIKDQSEQAASSYLGRQVKVGSLSFKPWSLELELRQITLAGAQAGDPPQLEIQRLYIDAAFQSLVLGAPVVDAVQIEGPLLRVTHLGGARYDVDDLLTRLTRPSDLADAPLPRFALYNLKLHGGSLDIQDLNVDQKHKIEDFQISLPFLSNLASKREVKTDVFLAFKLNGIQFDTSAEGTPFTQTHKSMANFRLKGFDVVPYLPYLPAGLPLTLRKGLLDIDLKLTFEETESPLLKLQGTVKLNEIVLSDAKEHDLVSFESISLHFDVLPLNRRLHIEAMDINSPVLALSRNDYGEINLARGFGKGGEASGSAVLPWQINVDRISLRGGSVFLRADGNQAPSQLSAKDLQMELAGLSWDGNSSILDIQKISLDDFKLNRVESKPSRSAAVLGFRELLLTQTRLKFKNRQMDLGQMLLKGPKARISRGSDQRWMFEPWLPTPSKVELARPDSERTLASADAPQVIPWAVALIKGDVQGGEIEFEDLSPVRPVLFSVANLNLNFSDFNTGGQVPAHIEAAAQIRTKAGEPGQVNFQGELSFSPVALKGRIQVNKLPAHAFDPYLADFLNIELVRTDASFKGGVSYRADPVGPVLALQGDASLESFLANSVAREAGGVALQRELLSWQALTLRGIELAVKPRQATRITVTETSITDFYARLTLYESGRFNLQDLLKDVNSASPATATTAQVQATGIANDPPAQISLGPMTLINGRVRFSDRFVKPNYTANLSGLTGKLGAFSTQPKMDTLSVLPDTVPMADLELRGTAEGSATIEITGKINPLAEPLAMQIAGKVRDLELPPLSAYAIKFAGYGIDRGKLSVDVSYLVKPNGQLVATNKIILNQLAFGNRVESSTSNLPVKLAVLLLADRNGVIDINLPLSGSLNDPEFRIGPIILKVIVNLIGKAITSPFSLLSNLIAGPGESLNIVSFPAGSATLTPAATRSLDQVAKVLTERPSLRLMVSGQARGVEEADAFKRERLAAMLLAEKRRQRALAGLQTGAPAEVTAAEEPTLLKAVYRRTVMEKPRNFLGLTQDLSVQKMQKLLLANVDASPEQIANLALRRGEAVKDYLSQTVSADRLFLQISPAVLSQDPWLPRTELKLEAN